MTGESIPGKGRPLRVLTANINGESGRYRDRMPLLRRAVAALDPDLMSFQEAGAYSVDAPHQVAEMLDGMGYHVDHQFDGMADPPGRDGNCVATRWPMARLELLGLQLTERCSGYPLAALAVRVHVPGPVGDVLLVSPKPSWELWAERERELQAVAIADLVERHADRGGFPPIVAGDFDATPEAGSIRFMKGLQSLEGVSTHFLDAWDIAGDGGPGYTWSCDNLIAREIIDRVIRQPGHRRRIDYIFLGSPLLYAGYARIVNCRVVMKEPSGGVWPTDHYGVYAEIAVEP